MRIFTIFYYVLSFLRIFVGFFRILGGLNEGFLRFRKGILQWCHLVDTSSNFWSLEVI
jgi:hypothetical protein